MALGSTLAIGSVVSLLLSARLLGAAMIIGAPVLALALVIMLVVRFWRKREEGRGKGRQRRDWWTYGSLWHLLKAGSRHLQWRHTAAGCGDCGVAVRNQQRTVQTLPAVGCSQARGFDPVGHVHRGRCEWWMERTQGA